MFRFLHGSRLCLGRQRRCGAGYPGMPAFEEFSDVQDLFLFHVPEAILVRQRNSPHQAAALAVLVYLFGNLVGDEIGFRYVHLKGFSRFLPSI